MKYLNLGCGYRYHSDWTNINFVSTGENIIACNLKEGIPFPNNSFDFVYHSHVLEHFQKSEAEPFLKECCRVLRPNGVLRVVVPDLEQIARMYLRSLEQSSNDSGFNEWQQNYEWMLLEMYDQTVRNYPGGEMKVFLSQQDLNNTEFVIKRGGIEIKNIILSARQNLTSPNLVSENLIAKLVKHIYRLLKYRDYRHQALIKLILSPAELDALKVGQFRKGGEVHQWMYDHYSLSVLLKNCGLEKITKRTAYESYINNWTSFNLDTELDGSVYKPDSLYIEAIKPIL